MEGTARGAVAAPPQTHGSSSVETSKLVLWLLPMPKDRGAEQGDVDGQPGLGHGGG